MKKYEYLSELEKRLSALPADARRDALNYYEEYFDAAGPDNEDATAAELGEPAEAARKILEGEGLTPDADPAAPESARGGAVPPAAPEPPAADPQPARAPKPRSRGKNHVADFRRCHCCGAAHSAGRPCAEFCKARRRHDVDGCCADGERNCCIRSCPHRGLLQRDRRHRGRGQRQPIGEDGFHHRLADAKNITFDIDYGAVTVVVDSGAAEPTLSCTNLRQDWFTFTNTGDNTSPVRVSYKVPANYNLGKGPGPEPEFVLVRAGCEYLPF